VSEPALPVQSPHRSYQHQLFAVNESALKLAHTLLAAEWTQTDLARACRQFATANGRGWQKPAKKIAKEVLRAYEIPPKDAHREFAKFLERACWGFDSAGSDVDDAETDNGYSTIRKRRIELPKRTHRVALAPSSIHSRCG
jgi:hypothetical protein